MVGFQKASSASAPSPASSKVAGNRLPAPCHRVNQTAGKCQELQAQQAFTNCSGRNFYTPLAALASSHADTDSLRVVPSLILKFEYVAVDSGGYHELHIASRYSPDSTALTIQGFRMDMMTGVNHRYEPAPAPDSLVPAAPAARRLLLVDDHELVRFGVRALHAEIGGVPIEWLEAGSLQEAIELYGRECDIKAVLLDLNLPDCKGLQGLRRFLQVHPRARVAIFSATQDEFVIRQARALGAVGYVGKSTLLTELCTTLTTLLWPAGAPGTRRSHTSGGGTTSALFPRFPSSAMFDRVAELGPRHLEILELVLSGCTNQEICNVTELALGTVKNYVSSLLLALDVTSRSHLISLFR